MESKKTSRVDESTIDNIISELEQMERRDGTKPTIGIRGEFSEEVREALEGKGYECKERGRYNLSTDSQDLERYSTTMTNHFPQRPGYLSPAH